MRPLYMCVHIPEFSAQAMLRSRPALRTEKIVVLEGIAPWEQVCSINRLARRLGVQRAMRRSELDSFTDLTLLHRSEAEENAAKQAVLGIAAVLTPRVEVQREVSPDHRNIDLGCFVFVLDITGSERLFGNPERIARRLLEDLRSIGIEARCALNCNLPAAVCLARAASRRLTMSVEGSIAATLSPLPLHALPLTPEQAETLSLWGLRTLGELAALPRLDLVVRLGHAGEHLWNLARGEAEHLMVPEEPAFTLEELVEFDAPVDDMQSLLFVAGPLLDQLIVRARCRALELASVTVHMQLDGGATHTRTLRPALPVADRALLLKLIQLDLSAHPPAAGVLQLRVSAEPGSRNKVQTGLFSPQMPEPMRLEVTLARIAALVGEGCVGRPQLTDSHASESFTVERFTPAILGTSSRSGRRSPSLRRKPPVTPFVEAPTIVDQVPFALLNHSRPATQEPQRGACARVALRRMRPPIPIRPRHDGGVLFAFHMQGIRYEVRECFGPWRRSGHWWSGEIWSREEWDISADSTGCETPDACLLCILSHDLLHDRWQMDAIYD